MLMGPFYQPLDHSKDSDQECPRGCNYKFALDESVFDHVTLSHQDI